MPKAVVADPDFGWEAERSIGRAWEKVVIYDAHLRGLVILHPAVPPEDHCTFRALGSAPVIRPLTDLGITSLELSPVQGFVQDRPPVERALSHYMGYNTLSFSA